jgi:glucose/arabinose dehydrogenase
MNKAVQVTTFLALAVIGLGLGSCGETAKLPLSAGIGPHPQLPPPNVTMFPTVNVAQAIGWRPGERPTPAPGLTVDAFATGLDHPRNVYVLPNGDVLVLRPTLRRSRMTALVCAV